MCKKIQTLLYLGEAIRVLLVKFVLHTKKNKNCIIATALICFFCSVQSLSQKNLLLNGGFEDHGDQKCLDCNSYYGKYVTMVFNWDNLDWGCRFCHQDYKRNSDEIRRKACPFEDIQPHEGKAMIEMWYISEANGIFGGIKGAIYLVGATTEPLNVGQLYEIKMWVYIPKKTTLDSLWAQHIGISLLPQKIDVHNPNNPTARLMLPYLAIDTIIYNEWHEVKWLVRPLCTSNYVMIGVYATNVWPSSNSYPYAQYYIDNISVKEITGLSALSDSSIKYCSRYDPQILGIQPKRETEILLFQNKSFSLTDAHKEALDSFSVYAKNFPALIFELSGHTDSIGTDNLTLSENRANAAYQYLTEVQNIPTFRLYSLSKSGGSPYRSNRTEEGRTLNRRVEIRQTQLTASEMFYRKALEAMKKGQKEEAFSNLNKWLIVSEQKKTSGLILSFDPRFEDLHSDKRWNLIDKKIRNIYNVYKYPQYAIVLDSMRLQEGIATGELTMGYQMGFNSITGYIPEFDSILLEIPPLPDSIIRRKNIAHYAALRPILEKVGWPKKSEFGVGACYSAFSILRKSENLVEILKWLPFIQKSCEKGETPWLFYAIFYDQCNLGLGKPQRFGTQTFFLENGDLFVKPWEGDANTVNEQRMKIGLGILSQTVMDAMLIKE